MTWQRPPSHARVEQRPAFPPPFFPIVAPGRGHRAPFLRTDTRLQKTSFRWPCIFTHGSLTLLRRHKTSIILLWLTPGDFNRRGRGPGSKERVTDVWAHLVSQAFKRCQGRLESTLMLTGYIYSDAVYIFVAVATWCYVISQSSDG